MAEQIEVISRYSAMELFGLLVAIIIVVSGVLVFFQKCYQWLESWRKRKNGIEDEKENIEKRVSVLEQNDILMNQKLDGITQSLSEMRDYMNLISKTMNKRLDEITENSRERCVANARATLYTLAKDLEGCDHISRAQYETFSSLSEIYRRNGGNSVFANKIIPFVESLPIKD